MSAQERETLAELIWTTSRNDESTISATGANHIADALLAAGWSRPASGGGEVEAATEDVIERARQVAARAVSDEFFRMRGGDPSWPGAPEPNEGDHAVGLAVLAALAAAGLLAGGVPGRSEAEIKAEALREAADQIDDLGPSEVHVGRGDVGFVTPRERDQQWRVALRARAARVAGTTEAGDGRG